MPSASTVYAAFVAHKSYQEKVVKASSGGTQQAAQVTASRAEQVMRALEPLVADESERLAAEVSGYIEQRRRPAA